MNVIRARVLGFCMGVRRAVQMALEESSARTGSVYTLGPLIHNSQVLEDLKKRGIRILEEGTLPPESENAVVIIRAHGVSPAQEAALARRGIRVVDATCPRVKQSQMRVRAFAEKGYRIFLAGEENHAEITGIRGYAQDCPACKACHVIANPDDAEKQASGLRKDEKTALIGQTTITAPEYNAIGKKLRQFFPALEIADTICGATAERQEALRELCGQVCAVVVAGGRQSANTRRLFSLARELGKPAWLVENPEEIPPEARSYKSIGLSAGASTPDSLITGIEQALKGLNS